MLLGMSMLACARWLRPLLLCALVGACTEPAGATRIVGPDGTQMLHVHCADEQVACFQLAGELCPHGYFLSPIFDPHDGNFLVRCRAWTDERALAVSPPVPPAPASLPSAAASVPSSRPALPAAEPDQSWPPAEVAKPAEPWPAPSAGAPPSTIGDVDSRY